MVRPERFELPTYSSGGCRSIQLSYGRAAVMQVYIVGSAASMVALRRSALDRSQRTFLPFIRLQNLLAQPQRLRRDLDKLIVSDKFDGLFEIEIAVRHQPNRLVGS